MEAKVKQLKQEAASYMRKRQKNELDVDTYKVLFTPYEKPTFDSKAFIANEKEGQDLYNKYLRKIQIERVTIKLAKA